MPQLDKIPILFQFKSFIVVFLFLYFFLLFYVMPIIHISLRLRKLVNLTIILSNLIIEFEYICLSLYLFFFIKDNSYSFLKIHDLLFIYINKQNKLNEFV